MQMVCGFHVRDSGTLRVLHRTLQPQGIARVQKLYSLISWLRDCRQQCCVRQGSAVLRISAAAATHVRIGQDGPIGIHNEAAA